MSRFQRLLTGSERYVPDLAYHRTFDAMTMARMRARHCEQGRHAWMGGTRGGVGQTWCTICDTFKPYLEPAELVPMPEDFQPGWYICDLRCLEKPWIPALVAGPFGKHIDDYHDLRLALGPIMQNTAVRGHALSVWVPDLDTYLRLFDMTEGPELLRLVTTPEPMEHSA